MSSLPPAPRNAKALLVSPETYEELRRVANAELIPDTADFQVQMRNGKKTLRLREKPTTPGGALPPFTVILGQDETGYYVTVTHGIAYERKMQALATENGLIPHFCDNRLDVDGNPQKFPMEIGDAIFVQLLEDEFGNVKPGEDVILVVADAAEESLITIPGVQPGIYLYKLAELVADGIGAKLDPCAAGSHIYHTTGLTADVILRDCPTYPEMGDPIPGAQLLRMSFVSGYLVRVGASEEDRPYAETVEETTVMYCS